MVCAVFFRRGVLVDRGNGRSNVWPARTPNPDVLAQKMKATWVLMEESALVEFLRGGCIASVKTMGCFQDVCSKFCAR